MKLLKLLCIPAAVAAAALAAVPVYAHNATVSNIAVTCTGGTKLCLTFHADLENSEGRDVTVTVHGIKGTADTTLGTFKVHLTPGQHDYSKDSTGKDLCVQVTAGQFDSFKVTIVPTDEANNDLDLTVNGPTTFPGSTCVAAQSPPATSSPSPSASASPVAQALAATGGFDYRFPLLGLPILVGGLALLLVTVARGRRSETK